MNKNTIVKTTSIVMIISFLSRIIGVLRDTLIASSFGATLKTDAYNTSLVIPNMIFGLFGLAITTTFIPILAQTLKEKGKEEMFDFANSIMNVLLVISLIFTLLGLIFTPQLVSLIANKYTGEKKELAIFLTRISIINILFLSLNSGYNAILQTLDEFTAPALVGIFMNIPILIYILMGNKFGIEGLLIATILGNGIQILVQIPWLVKHKYKYKLFINLNDSKIKKMMILISPVIIGTGVNQINSLVQSRMASGLIDGSITAIDISNKLNGMIYFTFAASIVTVIYPSLSKAGTSTDRSVFKEQICTAVNYINIIMIPAAIGLLVLRIPIISLLFKHGNFDEKAVNMTAYALLFLSSGMIFWGLRDVFSRAFYAIQDTKTPMINGVIGVFVNIIFSVVLVKSMGIGGLTLATTISAAVSCALLIVSLRKKIGYLNGIDMLICCIKILFASTIMGIGVYFINKFISSLIIGMKGQILSIAICIIAGSILYVIILSLLKVKEFSMIMNSILSKVRRKTNVN